MTKALSTALLIASLVALLGACEMDPNGSAIEGTWLVDEYLVTYSTIPGVVIDLAELSNITLTIGNGRYSEVCSPPCLAIVNRSEGTYTLDEARGRITFTVTTADLVSTFDHLEDAATGEQGVGKYSFPSSNRLRIEMSGVTYNADTRQFIRTDSIVTATRR